MKYFAATLIASTTITAGHNGAAATPPTDPEAALEVEFSAWADANGVRFSRLACDVTAGEGNVCFVLTGPDVAAYIPNADGTGWDLYGPEPAPVTPATPSPPAVQPLVADTDVYYANCDEARAAGDAPLYRGDPGYRSGLDRDDDGVACE